MNTMSKYPSGYGIVSRLPHGHGLGPAVAPVLAAIQEHRNPPPDLIAPLAALARQTLTLARHAAPAGHAPVDVDTRSVGCARHDRPSPVSRVPSSSAKSSI